MTQYLFSADRSFDLAPAVLERDKTPAASGGGSIKMKDNMQNKPNLFPFCAVNHDCDEKQTQTNPIQTHFPVGHTIKNRKTHIRSLRNVGNPTDRAICAQTVGR